ncbi:MAG: SUMF1/EgtB/PvdO family nonheme iron enzyme [Verrucomicrobiaceae bacterium]|nr:SUMF1/EgtB/PvdO family nonheme iron enzyme [Verrucomicrobiaceae bacterium]
MKAALGALLLIPCALLHAEKRVALVIGNSAYQEKQDHLPNAVADAKSVGEMLRNQLGFQVVELEGGKATRNLNKTDTFEAISALAEAGKNADIVLLYYAGHGMEEIDGRENYLMPVDADLGAATAKNSALKAHGVSLSDIIKDLPESAARIILLDCCRIRPQMRGAAPTEGDGLHAPDVDSLPKDTLIMLAAAPRKGASDGEGSNGPFALALLKHLPVPSTDMRKTFSNVRKEVVILTQNAQNPWLKLDAGGDYFFEHSLMAGGNVPPTPPAQVAKMVPTVPPSPTPLPPPSSPTVREMVTSVPTKPTSPQPPVQLTKSTSGTPALPSQGQRAGDIKTVTLSKPSESKAVEIKLVWCPPGSFLMGSPASEVGHEENENQVQVNLSQGFWIAQTECTQSQWRTVMRSNPSEFTGAKLPVERVTWEEASSFCANLNASSPQGPGLIWALPTEAQWEWACRAGTITATAFGESLTSDQANFNGDSPYGTNHWGANLAKTTAVGHYRPNGWGLLDMHGNLWEWCEDAWDGNAKLIGGRDPVSRIGAQRVVRGGSWSYEGQSCRSANRQGFAADSRLWHLGFRPVLVPDGKR